MDLLTHIAAGAAIGTTVAVCVRGSALKKTAIVLSGALGGALPDIDAISLWSKFDATFGKLFGLQHSGKVIYSAKFWYSHHGFMHSILASLIFGFILLLFAHLIQKRLRSSTQTLKKSIGNNKFILVAFIGGYFAHLLCDMPTPAATWGGVNLFFPFKLYVGGWGKIWWWNNYDIFIITNAVIFINLILLFASNFIKKGLKAFSITVLSIASILIIIQINTRNFDFNYAVSTSRVYQKNETKSKEIQQKILGAKLYTRMKKFDSSVALNF